MVDESSQNDSRGLSLFELLITLSLFLILCGLAFPHWHRWLVSNRVISAESQLARAIQYARHLAIDRALSVTLCSGVDPERCDGRWSDGYTIRLSSQVVRRLGALPPGYRLVWRSSLSENEVLTFTPDGFTDGQQGTFSICPPEPEADEARGLVILRSGRLRYLGPRVYASCSQS